MLIDPNITVPREDIIGQSPALDPANLGLPPDQSLSVRVNAFNCSYGPKDDGFLYERGYGYTVRMMFDSKDSVDKFMARPSLREDGNTIRHTAESMLQESFDIEGERDGDPVYDHENPDQDTMINTITSGTQGDIEATEPELEAILKGTFPDSGIVGVKIEDISPRDAMCYPSNGAPYADNAPAVDQSVTLGHLLPRQQGPGL